MAGLAKTTKFMLGAATVMIGAQADLFDFLPASHSVGLVKNFTTTSEPTYVELTQGVRQSRVYSVMTQNNLRAQMEVFEYTSKNLTYALGLDGTSIVAQTQSTTTTALVDGTSSPTAVIPVASVTGLAANDYIMIQEGTDDKVQVRQILSIASLNVTVTQTVKVAFASGSLVKKVNMISAGQVADQPFFAAKIVGTIADGTEMALLIPKIRITKGFSLAFNDSAFQNMPFEFEVFDLVAADTFYATFAGDKARLFSQT